MTVKVHSQPVAQPNVKATVCVYCAYTFKSAQIKYLQTKKYKEREHPTAYVEK